jgi:hypothetical protein
MFPKKNNKEHLANNGLHISHPYRPCSASIQHRGQHKENHNIFVFKDHFIVAIGDALIN